MGVQQKYGLSAGGPSTCACSCCHYQCTVCARVALLVLWASECLLHRSLCCQAGPAA